MTVLSIVMMTAFSIPTKAQNNSKILLARYAEISGGNGLRFVDQGTDKATIHGWNNPNQKISWKTDIKKGNYKIVLNYSQPRQGSAATFTIGNQQLAALFQPTGSWQEYKENSIGIIKVETSGAQEIVLTGIQQALEKNEKGELAFWEALPDLQSITLIPTTEKAQSGALETDKNFKGKSLFNGKNFDGWEGNNGDATMEWFRIQDGTLIGGTLEMKIPNNEFLRTNKQYGNFELQLDFKMANNKTANGGVQFRSIKHPSIPYEMYGYQADIISWNWGALYDESRRNKFLGTPLNVEAIKKSGKPEGWNHLTVRAEGKRIRIWFNHILALDYMEYDPEAALSGLIALQIHSGDPSELWYRNIKLQEL